MEMESNERKLDFYTKQVSNNSRFSFGWKLESIKVLYSSKSNRQSELVSAESIMASTHNTLTSITNYKTMFSMNGIKLAFF